MPFYCIHDGSNIIARGRTAGEAWTEFDQLVADGSYQLSEEAATGQLPIHFCYECAPCSESIYEDHSDDLSWTTKDGVIVHDL